MNRADWLSLAADYESEAQKQRASGNDEAARYWQSCARAAKESARQAEQEQQHERPIEARR